MPNIPPLDNFNDEQPGATQPPRNRSGGGGGNEPLPEMNIRDRWPPGNSNSATQSPKRAAADPLSKAAFTPPQRSASSSGGSGGGGGGVTASPSSLRVQSPRLPPSPVTNDESAADALMSLQRKRSHSSDESARKRLSTDQQSMSTAD